MNATIEQQIRTLEKLPARALRAKYRELFGEDSRSGNRQFLFRRVAWRLQSVAEGGLSERARNRAREIANDADVRVQAPKTFGRTPIKTGADPRLPAVGTVLRRIFQDRHIEVKVLDREFEMEGKTYPSLSAVAYMVTGTRWNGFAFFGLKSTQGKSL